MSLTRLALRPRKAERNRAVVSRGGGPDPGARRPLEAARGLVQLARARDAVPTEGLCAIHRLVGGVEQRLPGSSVRGVGRDAEAAGEAERAPGARLEGVPLHGLPDAFCDRAPDALAGVDQQDRELVASVARDGVHLTHA